MLSNDYNELTIAHSVRESSATLEATCISARTGLIFTVDSLALRLWSRERQVKSVHRSATDENAHTLRLQALAAFSIDAINCFAVVFTPRRATGASGGHVQIWSSPHLALMQDVELEFAPLRFCTLDATQACMTLVDTNSMLHILALDCRMVDTTGAHAGATSSYSSSKETPALGRTLDDSVPYCHLIHVQSIKKHDNEKEEEEEEREEVLAVCVVNTYTLAVLDSKGIVLYCREGGKVTAVANPSRSTTSGRKRRKITTASSDEGTFSRRQSCRIPSLGTTAYTAPCSLVSLNADDTFLVAFFDGTVQVVKTDTQRNDEDAQVLAELHVHECPSSNTEYIVMEKCQWSPSPCDCLVEIISVGPDRTIAIIGVGARRNTPGLSESAVTITSLETGEYEIKYEIKVLGRFRVPPEPPSQILSKDPGQRAKIGKILSFALTTASCELYPCRRQLVCPVGGMLLYLDFHLSLRQVFPVVGAGSLFNIDCASMGPSLADLSLLGGGDTLLILCNGIIHIWDPASSSIIREYGTLHLEDFDATSAIFDRIAGKEDKLSRFGKDNSFHALSKFREGRATAVYWDEKMGLIFVGYSTGGIGFIRIGKGKRQPNVVRNPHLDALDVHDSSIKEFLTFDQTVGLKMRRTRKHFLLVGDESGVLSLWNCSEQTIVKVWRAEAHKGSIKRIQYLSTGSDSSSPVVITACSCGTVKAWVQIADGSLILTSFFQTSGTLGAFLAVLIVDGRIGPPQRQVDETSSCEVGAFKSNLSTHKGGPAAKAPTSVTILCLCGFSSGQLEVWALSNMKVAVSTVALKCVKYHDSPLTWIGEFACADHHDGGGISLVCCAAGGSATLLKLSLDGTAAQVTNYFSLPIDAKQIAFCKGYCIAVGEQAIYEVIPFSRGRALPAAAEQPETLPHLTVSEESELDVDNQDSEALDQTILLDEYSMSETSFGKPEELYSLSTSSNQNQRAVTAEYYLAKKDRRFNEIYLQSQTSGSCGEVDVDEAISIIHKWLDTNSIGRDSIWQLMKMLDISAGQRLEFIKVAKVAAIAASAVKNKLSEKRSEYLVNASVWSEYGKLKKSHTTTHYNSVGEAVHLDTSFDRRISDGIHNGDVDVLRAELSKQPARVSKGLHSPSTTSTTFGAVMLESIPRKFRKLLFKDVQAPKRWDPSVPHWLDLRRAVRVARTLLDIRCTKQHEVSVEMPSQRGPLKTQSMPKLLVLYYERNFGSVRMNIASHKVVHYLEACLQYSQWPVMGILQRLLCPAVSIEEFSDQSLWILVELRKLLLSRGSVFDGGIIPTINQLGDIESKEDPTDMLLKWQTVSRADALGAVDEMFRIRGKFGITCVQRILDVVTALPSATEDALDLELFLYTVAAEFNVIEHFIAELDEAVFGLNSIPYYTVATSRDIVREYFSRVSLDEADRDAKMLLSLDRIRTLAEQFVHHDPLRTGTLDEITFRSIMVIAGDAILGFECGRDAHKLVDICIHRFKGTTPDSTVCYLDFWACLLAYLSEFHSGAEGLDGTEALNSITGERRGLDEAKAFSLTVLLQYMQCPHRDTFSWTTGLKALGDAVLRNQISRNGLWKGDVSVPVDLPGSLTAKEFKSASISLGTMSIYPPRLEIQEQLNASQASFVPATDRSVNSLYGEVTRPSKTITALTDRAPLHLTVLSLGDFVESPHTMARESYSRSVQSFTIGSSKKSSNNKSIVSSAPSSTQGDYEIDLGFYPPFVDSQDLQKYNQVHMGAFVSDDEAGGKLQALPLLHGNSSDGAPQVPLSTTLVALDGMERRRLQLITEEQDLLTRQRLEEEKFALRRGLRELHHKKKRRQDHQKEVESMNWKVKADEEREARNARARESYARALKAEQDDQRRSANQALDKIIEEKMRMKKIAVERHAKEMEEAERRRELDERLVMRKEEHASMEAEAAIAEKLRIAKEKAEKEAEEVAKHAAAERERLRVEEEKRRVDEERQRAMADAAAALKEGLNMAQEDVNILLIITDVGADELLPASVEETASVEAGEALEVEPGKDDIDDGAATDTKVSQVTLRMNLLLAKLKSTQHRHTAHPRWTAQGGYFMPQLFSPDISFLPFDSSAENQSAVLETWNAAEIGQQASRIKKLDSDSKEPAVSNSFEDITNAVKEHKLFLIRQRLEQLYQTSSADETPADWTEVFRIAAVDWGFFFHQQEDILYERPVTPPPTIDEEAVFRSEMMSAFVPPGASEKLSKEMDIPQSLLQTYDLTKPQPLPFGSVVGATVLPGSYKYYQVEITDPSAFVTMELKVSRGVAEMLTLEHELPTVVCYSRRAQAELFNKRIARLSFVPKRDKSIFVGVYSEEGAKFEIWVLSSADPNTTSSSINLVSKSLREFELLSNQPDEYLHVKLPALVEQAKRIVEFEYSMAKPSILSEYQNAIDSHSYEPTEEKDEDLDEIAVMDRFISKAGRRLMRKDLLEGGPPTMVNDDPVETVNPNSHIDLFPKARLTNHTAFLEMVSNKGLGDHESMTFNTISLPTIRGNPLQKKFQQSHPHQALLRSPIKPLTKALKPLKYSLSLIKGNKL